MSEELSYEAAREELVAVVAKLESGGATLADSMALWRRGEELAAVCQAHLDAASAQVSARDSEKSPDEAD